MLPAYTMNYAYKCPPGRMHYQKNKKWVPCQKKMTKKLNFGSSKIKFTDTHIKNMAKKMGVKLSSGGKRRTSKSLFSAVMKKGESIIKSKKDEDLLKYVTRHCHSMAKKLSIPKTRNGRKKTCLSIWKEIAKKGCDNVTRKRSNVSTKKSSSKVRKPRKRYTRKSGFGSWWDNTQQLYGGTHTSKQAADASTLMERNLWSLNERPSMPVRT